MTTEDLCYKSRTTYRQLHIQKNRQTVKSQQKEENPREIFSQAIVYTSFLKYYLQKQNKASEIFLVHVDKLRI